MNTTPETVTNSRRSRKPMVAGVAAGLVAGGAIGLAAMVPSITSAAADDAPTLQDDTSVDAPVDDAGGRPERGEQLREVLQPLVDDGTIDAGQADAVASHLIENRPERDGHRHRRGIDGHGRNGSVVADLLGVERAELRESLQSGLSIADIAEQNGVDIQVVIDGLIADAESHIELAIAHGLDEEAAAERLAKVTERIEEGVYKTRSTDG